jgi:hypothetical protein
MATMRGDLKVAALSDLAEQIIGYYDKHARAWDRDHMPAARERKVTLCVISLWQAYHLLF